MTDPELRRLLDIEAIRALAASYADAVTHLDAGRAASVYAEDGRVEIAGAEITGRAAIEEGMRTTFAQFALLRLVEHGGVIEIEGDAARARWSTIELTVRTGSDDLNIVFGRYEDALVREAAGWRFASRRFTLAGRTRLPTDRMRIEPLFAPPEGWADGNAG